MTTSDLDDLDCYFEYLDNLRASGVTNMFGAAPYLMEEYGLSKELAKDVTVKWMKTFDAAKSPEARAREAQKL